MNITTPPNWRLHPGSSDDPLSGEALDRYLNDIERQFLLMGRADADDARAIAMSIAEQVRKLHAAPRGEQQYRRLLENAIVQGVDDGKDWAQLRALALADLPEQCRPLIEAKLLAYGYRVSMTEESAARRREEALVYLEQMPVQTSAAFDLGTTLRHWGELSYALGLTRKELPLRFTEVLTRPYLRFLEVQRKHLGSHPDGRQQIMDFWYAMASFDLCTRAGDKAGAKAHSERAAGAIRKASQVEITDIVQRLYTLQPTEVITALDTL